MVHMLAAMEVGPYLDAFKALPAVIMLIVWGRLLTWADKDTIVARLPREAMMGGLLGGLIFGFGLFIFLPGFLPALGGLFLVFFAEVGAYLVMRNAKVGLADLKGEISHAFSFNRKPREVKAVAGAVQFVSKGGALVAAPNEEDPSRAAYEACQKIFTLPLTKEADQIELVHAEGGMACRFAVDGVAYAGTTLDKASGGMAIEYIKALAGMDINERRKPQSGTMRVSINGKKRELKFTTRGSTAGESMSVAVDLKNRFTQLIDNAGFRADQTKKIRDSIEGNTGIVLVSAPSKQGLTTTMYALLKAHDAFLQHIQTIEREVGTDLEGITQNKLSAAATPADELKQVGWVISQEPDVVLISDIQESRSAVELLQFSQSHRVYVGMRSASSLDAITDWRKLIGDDKAVAATLNMSVAARVIRKLCNACKVGYTPDPTTLRKLNMDPDKVGQLFQARSQPVRDQKGNVIPCDFCHDLHFKGRVGVFEVFAADEEVKQVIAAGGSINQLKALFRKQRCKLLLEQSMGLVEAGDTSVQEVLRVLKPPAAAGFAKPQAR